MKRNIKNEQEFTQILENETKKANIYLSENQLKKLALYKDILLEWNEKINLTSIVDEYEIIMKHFIDCLELVKYIDEDKKVIDVGTGAGFPGIVLSIYFDSRLNITLLDALDKRINFLKDVINRLELKNITLVHGRAEECANQKEYREKYDIVVSRAVANLPVLLEYEIPYVKVNGCCLVMKSSNVDEEIKNSKNALNVLNSKIENSINYSYFVNEEEYKRVILVVKKYKQTDSKYPRNNGKIKKKSL